MQTSSIYLVSFVSTVGALALWKIFRQVDAPTRRLLFSFLRKNLTYTLVYRRRRGSSDINILSFFNIVLFIAANITACTLRLADRTELARRCAALFMINVVTLYLGGRTSLLADQILRIPLPDYNLIHRWMGRVCVVQGLLHGIINATISSSSVTETLLLSLLAALGCLSFLYVRRFMFEVFIKTHLLFALALAITLWFHIRLAKTRATICLSIASALWLTQHITWLARVIYRNFGAGSPKNMRISQYKSHPNCVQAMSATITPKRPWKVCPGHYVYLTLPGISRHRAGFIQSHPYIIAWEDEDTSDITLLIQRRRGFSNDIVSVSDIRSSVIIDGPYGHPLPLDDFDKVLFVASGIGIAAHLLAIKHLIKAHNSKKARVRRLTLFWFLETYDQEEWARQFLDALFEIDVRHIFTMLLFVPSDSSTSIHHQNDRWVRTSNPLHLRSNINKEYDLEAGSMAVSVCGTPTFEEAVRRAIRTSDQDTSEGSDNAVYRGRDFRDIYYFSAGFQPEETNEGRLSRLRYS